MPKKSAAHQKKVDEAVRILNTTTGVIVPQAMILAGFPKKDIANETVRRMIRHRLEALEAKQRPLMVVVVTNNDADLSTLTGEDTTTTTTTGPAQHPKPKQKQIRHTARWFDSWETFLVEYGFATINEDGSLHITEEMKARILNFDKTCFSLDGSNSNRGGRPTVT